MFEFTLIAGLIAWLCFELRRIRVAEEETAQALEAIYEILLTEDPAPEPEASQIQFYSTISGNNERVHNMFLKASQNLPLSIQIKDKFGNAAQVDGAPQWAVTDATLGAMEVSEDGMSATFKPAGLVGTLKIQVSADADLGEGVKSILGELDVEILAGEAVSVEIAAGEPSDA